MGRADYLKLGDWNAICDRCGFKYKASQLRHEWTGLYVCQECWEPRHEQDFVRGVEDDPSVPWTRPDHDPSGGTDINGDTIPATFTDYTDDVPTGTFTSNNSDLDRSDD